MANQKLELDGAVDADPKGCLLFGLLAIAIALLILSFAIGRVATAIEHANQPAQEAPIAH